MTYFVRILKTLIRPYDVTLIYAAYAKCKILMAYAAYAKIQNTNDFFKKGFANTNNVYKCSLPTCSIILTVPKKIIYFFFPFTGSHSSNLQSNYPTLQCCLSTS